MKTNCFVVSVVSIVRGVSVVLNLLNNRNSVNNRNISNFFKREDSNPFVVSVVSIVGKVSVVLIVPAIEVPSTTETFQTLQTVSNKILQIMNKYVAILFLVLLSACSTSVNRNDASISFNKEKHDFGTIQYKKEAACTFEFSNTGKSALVIYDVKSSCGCTVPEWTKEPIRPGKKGLLKIKYDAAFPGVFHKTVEVTYNGPGSPVSLEITGEVEYPENSKL